MQSLLADKRLRQNLNRSAENIAVVSERGKAIAANLESASVGGREIVARFQKTTGRLDTTAAMLQQTVGENRAKLGQTLTSVNDTMDALKGLVEQLTTVVADPKVKGGLRGTVANIEQATSNLAKMSSSLQQLSADPKLNEDLRATVSGTRATVDQMQILLQRVNHLLGVGHKSAAGAREKVESTNVTVDLAEQTRPGRARLDLNAYIPAGGGRFYRLGLNDLTETNKLNLQLGRPFLGNSLRYGLYSSRLGMGLDIGAPSHPHFSADLYSLADPQLDLRARAQIRDGFDLTLGVLSAFHRNTPTVGVTWRK
jgi:phospholipid/cholesterol/gamma-HCH transport system substrate-binding protein